MKQSRWFIVFWMSLFFLIVLESPAQDASLLPPTPGAETKEEETPKEETEPAEKPGDEEPEIESVTTGDPEISLEELGLLLTPLTKAELEAEAKAWRDLLQKKVTEVSQAEIKSRALKEDDKPEAKQEVLDELVKLREEQAAIVSRLGKVLDAWDSKGGIRKNSGSIPVPFPW